MAQEYITNFLVWYLVFLFSTTLHEAMHSYVSHHYGDSTAAAGGQASLNPVPHIRRSPFGMVIVPIVTFILANGNWLIGWASAPFNPYWAARYPKRSFLMSLAGPFSHLPLVIISLAAMHYGLGNGFFGPLTGEMFPVDMGNGGKLSWALAKILNVVFQLNIILLIFNLLPLPPMDGSEVWYLFAKNEADRLRWRSLANQYSMIGLLLAWWLFPKIFSPILLFLVFNVLYAGFQGV